MKDLMVINMDDQLYRGIIIRQNNYGDAHRMLSVFTETDGIVKAVRYGVRGKKASNAAAFQMLSYGDFRLRPSRGEVMTAVSADVIDGFFPVCEDIVKLALVNYFADITYSLLGEGNPDRRILSLFLNTVYAAAYRAEPLSKLKCVYEFKLMCAGGYMPDTSGCAECGGAAQYFSPDGGCFSCSAHRRGGDMPVSAAAVSVMRYLAGCPDRRMLAFGVPDVKIYRETGAVTERYVSAQADREFASLSYFKSVAEMQGDVW